MGRLTNFWRIRSTPARRLCRTAWNSGLGCLRSVWETLLQVGKESGFAVGGYLCDAGLPLCWNDMVAPFDTCMPNAMWHGTGAELTRLRVSLGRNWASAIVMRVDAGVPVYTIVCDQQLVDGLFGAHRSRKRFIQQEFTGELVDLLP